MKESVRGLMHNVRQMVMVTLVLMLICGFLFPMAMSGLSAVMFPHQANGSLIMVDGKPVASEHVGQQFVEDYYMWSRPSAYNYNVYVEDEEGNQHYRDGSEFAGLGSGSNNYAPSNPMLAERVEAEMTAFLEKTPGVVKGEIPTDLMTASGSGLDPNISPESADIQVSRIAKASGLEEDKIRKIIQNNTTDKLLGIFGDEIVNVVKVNIEIGSAMGILPATEK